MIRGIDYLRSSPLASEWSDSIPPPARFNIYCHQSPDGA